MPRSKPKAQRLAPPSSASQSEPDSHAHPSQPISHHEQRRNHQEKLALNQSRLSSSPISRTSKTRELPISTSSKVPPSRNHAQPRIRQNTPNRRRSSDPSTNSIPATVLETDLLPAEHPRPSSDAFGIKLGQPESGSLPPNVSRPSSPLSCATSDTASVGLKDCVPELEEFDDIVLPGMEARRNPSSYKPTARSSQRDSKVRVSNGSVGQSSKSRSRVSEGSTAKKAVIADPTAGPASSVAPAPALEVCNPVRAEQMDKSKKPSFIFVSDDEVKSVFDRERVSTDGSGVSAADADRNRFGDYWKELETVSIRRSAHAKTGRLNGGQQRVRKYLNKVPSLDPANRGSSSNLTKSAGERRATKHSKPGGNLVDVEMEDDRHPITEENIDGSDAVPVGVKRKRKLMKRARHAHDSFRRSSAKQRSQWHSSNANDPDMLAAENREGDESIRGGGTGTEFENRADDGEETGGSTGFSESDGQACMQCRGHGKASKMVLCDVCSDGCHTFCMRPARASVPLGVWICPRCHTVAKKHKVHLSQLPAFLKGSGRARQ